MTHPRPYIDRLKDESREIIAANEELRADNKRLRCSIGNVIAQWLDNPNMGSDHAARLGALGFLRGTMEGL